MFKIKRSIQKYFEWFWILTFVLPYWAFWFLVILLIGHIGHRSSEISVWRKLFTYFVDNYKQFAIVSNTGSKLDLIPISTMGSSNYQRRKIIILCILSCFWIISSPKRIKWQWQWWMCEGLWSEVTISFLEDTQGTLFVH